MRRSSAQSAWQSVASSAQPGRGLTALDEALTLLKLQSSMNEATEPWNFCIVSIGASFERDFREIVTEAYERLERPKAMISILGSGVIGGGRELESQPCVSILAGSLKNAETKFFQFGTKGNLQTSNKNWAETSRLFRELQASPRLPSFFCFADPSAPVPAALDFIDECLPKAIVVGGLSCPRRAGIASIALNDQILTPGTVGGVAMIPKNEHFALHSVTAQGALGIGPTFKVTSGRLNLVNALDSEPALAQVQKVALSAIKAQPRLAELLQNSLLVGITSSDADMPDFLIRTVVGATSDGAIAVGDNTITENSTRLRLHVRDSATAITELDSLLQRYSLERAIAGFSGIIPNAIFLSSCNGRGRHIFPESNFELTRISSAFPTGEDEDHPTIPVAGFFANGEIGPTGAAIPSSSSHDDDDHHHDTHKRTYLHGFTSVITFIYDDLDHTPPPPEDNEDQADTSSS